MIKTRLFPWLALLLCCAAGPAAGAATHCADTEENYFSCPLENGRLVSLCLSRDAGPESGSLELRYGPPGRVEASVPAVRTAPAQSASLGRWVQAGSIGQYVQFNSGDTFYFVYSGLEKVGRSRWASRDREGLAILRQGEALENHPCAGPPERSRAAVKLFEGIGLPPSAEEFSLP